MKCAVLIFMLQKLFCYRIYSKVTQNRNNGVKIHKVVSGCISENAKGCTEKENKLKFTLLCPNRASKLVSMLNVQIERSCLYTIHAVPELKALVRGGSWLLGGNQHCIVSRFTGRGSLNVDIMSWKEVNRNFYHQSYFITYPRYRHV